MHLFLISDIKKHSKNIYKFDAGSLQLYEGNRNCTSLTRWCVVRQLFEAIIPLRYYQCVLKYGIRIRYNEYPAVGE